MRNVFKKLALAAALATLAIFSLQNCRNEPKTTTTTPPDDAATTKTLRLRIEQDATNMNPLMSVALPYSRYVSKQIFQALGIVDPKTLELKPLIIKSLPQLRKVAEGPFKGCIAYDFEIMDEAIWDNGTPITGNDVVFTIKAIMHPDLPTAQLKGYFESLRDVEVDAANPKRFTAFLKQYYLLGLETLCQFDIYPAYNYDPAGKMASTPLTDFLDPKKAKTLAANPDLKAFAEEFKNPKYATEKAFISGSGAYEFEFMKAGEGVVLSRKKNWWADKAAGKNPLLAAFPEKLSYRAVPQEPPAVNMLQNNELDLFMNISAGKFLELKANADLAKKYDFGTQTPTTYSYFLCNTRNAKLADRHVRTAIAHAIDYDYVVNNIFKGFCQRIVGPIHPMKPYYNKDLVPYQLDLEKSKKLLSDAGWKDTDGNGLVDKVIGGKKTDLTLNVMATTTSESTRLTVENIKESLKKVGIGIEIVALELAKISAETKAGNYEAAVLAAAIFPGDVDLYQSLHSKNLAPTGDNRSFFADPRADKLISDIRTQPDPAIRDGLYKQLQVVLYEELPYIFLVAPEQRYAVSKRYDPMMSPNRPGYYEALFRLKN